VALIVGDGTGLEFLRNRAGALGVSSRCRFVGRVAFDEVGQYVSAMDGAISTQTNDLVGHVRTTGKLPLYLAYGCPVIASHVGEAARILGPLGWTQPYYGVVDRSYPSRLAIAIEQWSNDPCGASRRRHLALKLAREIFDADTMRLRIADLIATLDKTTRRTP
jgi:glycosyltransferase involved in cell wall biosynthesis